MLFRVSEFLFVLTLDSDKQYSARIFVCCIENKNQCFPGTEIHSSDFSMRKE